jgi:hypothetical protein
VTASTRERFLIAACSAPVTLSTHDAHSHSETL